jgi:hypothetical protein
MYTFVLEWTPALTPPKPAADAMHTLSTSADKDNDGHLGTIPHGYIFAAFMVSGINVFTFSFSGEII